MLLRPPRWCCRTAFLMRGGGGGWAAIPPFPVMSVRREHKLLSQQNTSLLCLSVSFHEEFHIQGVELKHCSGVYATSTCPQGWSLVLPGTLSMGIQSLAKERQRLMGACFWEGGLVRGILSQKTWGHVNLGLSAHEGVRDLLSPSWVARLESTEFWFLVCSSASIPISGF